MLILTESQLEFLSCLIITRDTVCSQDVTVKVIGEYSLNKCHNMVNTDMIRVVKRLKVVLPKRLLESTRWSRLLRGEAGGSHEFRQPLQPVIQHSGDNSPLFIDKQCLLNILDQNA